ncbi:hypothetical protein KC345_g316 [Hortaea werneckii]|nr:hypothetical protein KC345_g316 [Hortaea werneckii]
MPKSLLSVVFAGRSAVPLLAVEWSAESAARPSWLSLPERLLCSKVSCEASGGLAWPSFILALWLPAIALPAARSLTEPNEVVSALRDTFRCITSDTNHIHDLGIPYEACLLHTSYLSSSPREDAESIPLFKAPCRLSNHATHSTSRFPGRNIEEHHCTGVLIKPIKAEEPLPLELYGFCVTGEIERAKMQRDTLLAGYAREPGPALRRGRKPRPSRWSDDLSVRDRSGPHCRILRVKRPLSTTLCSQATHTTANDVFAPHSKFRIFLLGPCLRMKSRRAVTVMPHRIIPLIPVYVWITHASVTPSSESRIGAQKSYVG